ncbi:MAG: formate dehydrogenase accessory sulfurtransferase FdhD [Dehalococcoidales bacterium]|nr:formate dehydrogenase family accessory protein FdhD [Dehalococcoidales bacterium]MDP6501018.1 formate dehydrogenase accessory sulfurtransferase FdhD [Dehalococcoidales bacterium]MDP6632463.1 formate dehydrogenase accessory sulfurtransferase FdhD [Dehalococcoidales bacterium]
MRLAMETETEKIPIVRLIDGARNDIEDLVAKEFPLTLILNNQELVTFLCSPKDLDYLSIGFLYSEGLLDNKDEIKKITVDAQRGVVRVETNEDRAMADDLVFKRLITSGCGRGASFYSAADMQNQVKINSEMEISANEVISLVRDFQHHSQMYRTTGGVHSAALCDPQNILVFSEDIGRHNALDKIFGECLLKDISSEGRVVVTSGRISSEMLLKVARRNIPIIISKSAPTDLGVKMADDLGITLLGFVRGKRINVYTNDWRISGNGRH